MSVYSCIDLINQAITPSTGTLNKMRIVVGLKSTHLIGDEREFLIKISNHLQIIAPSSDYQTQEIIELYKVLKEIKDYSASHAQSKQLSELLTKISLDLQAVVDRTINLNIKLPPKKNDGIINDAYTALVNSPLLVKSINQGKLAELGNDLGGCYGFTFSMADSALSPYKGENNERQIKFSKEIYEYQTNQTNRNKDQGKIKKTRLTRKFFCPSFKQQAENLYEIANQRPGKDLAVMLSGKVGAHSVYLSRQDDGKIRYMDPNHGAFLFDTKEQFIAAYRLLYMQQSQQTDGNAVFQFYSVDQLREDPQLKEKESRTFAGKIRTLLTGSKYLDNHFIPRFINIGLSAGVGALVGGIVGSVLPVIGTLIGVVIGGIIGGMGGSVAITQAERRGHFGLLGVIHACKEQLYRFKESMKGKLGIQRDNDVKPDLNILKKDTVSTSISTPLNGSNAMDQLTEASAKTPKRNERDEHHEQQVMGSDEVIEDSSPVQNINLRERLNSLKEGAQSSSEDTETSRHDGQSRKI